jgi:hypothetical protein
VFLGADQVIAAFIEEDAQGIGLVVERSAGKSRAHLSVPAWG